MDYISILELQNRRIPLLRTPGCADGRGRVKARAVEQGHGSGGVNQWGTLRAVVWWIAALLRMSVGIEAGTPSPWGPDVTVSIKEEYDSNVFLQDMTPLADHASMVSTIIPAVGIHYQGDGSTRLRVSYAPEVAFFHSEASEDHVLHRVGFGGSGRAGRTDWDWQNSFIGIVGDDVGITFTGPGGAPAAGGPRVRDRRDAAIYRGGIKATQPLGKAFLRPMISAYLHDFQTEHRDTAGYLNYVDRKELVGGVDAGAETLPGLRGWVGYRFGVQDQSKLLNHPEEYDNHFHRVLFAFEGAPATWLKVTASVGPEFREYGDKVPASFGDHDVLRLFVDATITFTLGDADTLIIAARQFEQPAFGGRAAYEDLTYDLNWRHKFGDHLALGILGRAYNTEFLYPALRNDWVISSSATISWTFNKQLQAEASFTYEDGESTLPNTGARGYSREVVAIGIRYGIR